MAPPPILRLRKITRQPEKMQNCVKNCQNYIVESQENNHMQNFTDIKNHNAMQENIEWQKNDAEMQKLLKS